MTERENIEQFLSDCGLEIHPKPQSGTLSDMTASGWIVDAKTISDLYAKWFPSSQLKSELKFPYIAVMKAFNLRKRAIAGTNYVVGIRIRCGNESTVSVGTTPKPSLVAGYEWVTPTLAKTWLSTKRPNRRISDVTVARYAHDMRAGNWIVTHQGVAFDTMSRLCDGQQRLSALVESGVAQWLLVVRGVSEAAVRVIDTGRNRSVADTVAIEDGVDHASSRVAIVRILLAAATGGNAGSPRGTASGQEVQRAVISMQSDLDWVLSYTWAGIKYAPVRAALIYARRADPEKVSAFAKLLNDGDVLSARSPAHTLREALVQRIGKGSGTTSAEWFRSTLAVIQAHLNEQKMARMPTASKADSALEWFRSTYEQHDFAAARE